MKDLAAVEEAVGLRAKIYEGQALSKIMQSLTTSASGWPQRSWQIPCFPRRSSDRCCPYRSHMPLAYNPTAFKSSVASIEVLARSDEPR